MAAAGPMDRRATFERRAVVSDGKGNERGAWGALLTVWADLRRPRSSERVEAAAQRSAEAGELRFRDSAAARGVTAADRVRIDGRLYRLRGDPVEAHPRSGVLMVLIEREA